MQTIYGDKEIFIESSSSIDDMDDLIVRLYVGKVLIDSFNKAGSGDFKALIKHTPTLYSYLLEPSTYSQFGTVDVYFEIQNAESKWSDDIKNSISLDQGAYKIARIPWQT